MTNENLNPPEISDLYELFFDNNIDEAEGLVLEDILDNDNTDFVTMEQLPGGLDTDRKFKDIVMKLSGHSEFKINHNQLLKRLGEIWWLHIKETIDSDSFDEQVNEKVIDMYEGGEY